MSISRQVPVRSLALVVMAAGVATASPEFTVDAIGEFTPIPLSDMLRSLSDSTPGYKPAARR
jgi:hypothetical protein